jgi:uncharacterized membrane-anchored protein YhcB (DUF1043 family)
LFEWLKWDDSAWLDIWQFYSTCEQALLDELKENTKKNAALIKWCQQKRKEHNVITGNKDYAFTALLYEMLQFLFLPIRLMWT